MIDPASSQQQH